ncbi:PfkB family carbohydrate kinase [Membranihabitans maritimus]|uniref:PfkB family carbohydrate kinase n=1 Tax=Membranihabitans maritimus TaxID=2904244 RepID=UPI001F3B7E4B|nr:PfkB family carbohydrate kinase [Membranihabitans maritimus]
MLKDINVLAVGEVLFDVIQNNYKLGGAPFNVAAHMAQLKNNSYILSTVGSDHLGDQIEEEAKELGVHTDFLVKSGQKPTGTVEVVFNDGEPDYEIMEDVAYDYLQVKYDHLESVNWDIVLFGTLAQRTANNQVFYEKLLHTIEADWIYFDANLRREFYNKEVIETSLKAANIIKFNEEEIAILSNLLYGEKLGPEFFADLLRSDYNVEICIFTFGKDGSKAFYQGKTYTQPIVKVRTRDTVGAGDAFNAGFLDSWVQEKDIQKGLAAGSRLGAFVAGQRGAIPRYDSEIKSFFGIDEEE